MPSVKDSEFTGVPIEASESEESVDESEAIRFREAVLGATDWTVETLINQLLRQSIVLDPSFQRRDAWNLDQKSRFIESLILNLPVPQIVLAEAPNRGGNFIVLDGKQRLLSILQFWGLGEGKNNEFGLSGLKILKRLKGSTQQKLKSLKSSGDSDLYNGMLTHTIRTVVIKNWPNDAFLHTVFVRLNTGSLQLSPQELRQALFPGPFSKFIDLRSSESVAIQELLGIAGPDRRMRDIETLARYLMFKMFMTDYSGRMREALDNTYKSLNKGWSRDEDAVREECQLFERSVYVLADVFGMDEIARKPGSTSFNRAIFDFLIFYASRPAVAAAMTKKKAKLVKAYETLFQDQEFSDAVRLDTAGLPNTVLRFNRWASTLRSILPASVHAEIPTLSIITQNKKKKVQLSTKGK